MLINGAGGSIGTYAVQLAKNQGAEITAVDSGDKLEMLKSIGADHVLDYQQTNFVDMGKSYDIIFDVIGKAPLSKAVTCLNENGIYLNANPTPMIMLRSKWKSSFSDKTVISGVAETNSQDMVELLEMLARKELRAVVDRRYTLEQMREAHQYVESGQKQGHVIIDIPSP